MKSLDYLTGKKVHYRIQILYSYTEIWSDILIWWKTRGTATRKFKLMILVLIDSDIHGLNVALYAVRWNLSRRRRARTRTIPRRRAALGRRHAPHPPENWDSTDTILRFFTQRSYHSNLYTCSWLKSALKSFRLIPMSSMNSRIFWMKIGFLTFAWVIGFYIHFWVRPVIISDTYRFLASIS